MTAYGGPLMVHDGQELDLFRTKTCHLGGWIWSRTLGPAERCSLLFIPLFPSAIAICVLMTYVLRPLLHYGPKWTKPFVQELYEQRELQGSDVPKRPERSPVVLLITCLAGLTLQILTAYYTFFHAEALLLAFPWTIACLIAAIDRPKTAPIGLLTIVVNVLAIQITLLVYTGSELRVQDIPTFLGVFAALSTIITILRMPLRDPEMSSKEISKPFEPPSHELRTPEDSLTLWQFLTISWMSPLISLGYSRQLNDEDIWGLGFEFQHRKLHHNFRELQGSVVGRLLVANGLDCVITTFLGILELVANYAAPVLLQQLLRSMEVSHAFPSEAIIYAVLRLVVRLIGAQSYALGLWFSRRSYERSRGEMITMLYEKTLSRKIIGAHAQQAELPEENIGGSLQEFTKSKVHPRILWSRLSGWMSGPPHPENKVLKQPASMGKILNLMHNDVYEVAQRFWEFPSLITKPFGLILSVVLIWRLIGWPCLIGVFTVIVAQGVNALITRLMLRWERKRRVATDSRLQKTNQFVEAIRHLRWYGWQDSWRNKIMDSRQQELRYLMIARVWGIMISFTNTFASGMFPVVAFYAYTALAGQPLRVDVAFPALQLFSMLEGNLRDIPGLITVLLNAHVAVGRIEDFMSEPDKIDEKIPLKFEEAEFALKSASFTWPGTSHTVLCDVNLGFPIGLTVICGKVAAGKTALLQALLGELDKLGGEIIRPNEMVGYCAQSPWLQSMSIRDNILFSSPYDEARYKEVLDACALSVDLANFKHGDLSNIGENGIGLSGGQRARVALARAVYSRAQILLLDDPLSALDHQTAETVMRRCFGGSLLNSRTVILVTHRTDLCHRWANQTVAVSEGKARVLGTEASLPSDLDKVGSHESTESIDQKRDEEDAVPENFMEDEHRAHGGVKAAIYWEYIKAGSFKWWAILTCLMAVYRLINIGETWFLKQWGEAYDKPSVKSSSGLFDNLPSPEANIRPWLLGFFLLAAAQAVMLVISQGFMQVIIFSAASQMFRDVVDRVSHATFRFYDVTPVGRLMNRLTSDIGTVDGNISQQLNDAAFLSIYWVSSLIVIASVTPVFLVFSLALTTAFVFIFLQYLPTSQSLRRLEMVSLSPLMSNFGALLDGLTTVRAFRAQSRFQDRVITVVDAFQKMDHFYWHLPITSSVVLPEKLCDLRSHLSRSLQAWITYRFDILSASSTLLLTLLAIYTNISPGLTAFVLTASASFVYATHALCRRYGNLQMDFVSVERVVELLHLDQEPPGTVDPPAWWPSSTGDIIFDNVTVRYAPHLDSVLQNVSLRIPGGSTTAVLGRTGSGKSTLAISILATVLPESGQILIDNIPTSDVNIQALRNRITFLPQDPVLFPGTLRENLDPLEEHSEDACEAVLARVCGTYGWTLYTQIDIGGKNLSQGQRQLVGLARAVLRRSAIVILDEATASIDQATSLRIQQILREELASSTVITIAHRLEAVKDASFRIALKDGRVNESGPAPSAE